MKYLQHTYETKKHLEHTLQIYVYSYRKICNIAIYFCNIDIKYLQHISDISETLKIYICNLQFQCNIFLLFRRLEARRCVEAVAELEGPVGAVAPNPMEFFLVALYKYQFTTK
jgi:hypothetical protein